MKLCKNCGEINENDSLFCCNCGKSEFVFQEEVVCPHCGASNNKDFAHCTNCGKPLEKQSTQTSTASSVAVNLRQEMSDLYGVQADESEMSACPECGEMMQGLKLGLIGANGQTLIEKEHHCPKCNSKTEMLEGRSGYGKYDLYCPRCKEKLDAESGPSIRVLAD